MAAWRPEYSTKYPEELLEKGMDSTQNPIRRCREPNVVIQSSAYPLSIEQKLALFVNAFMSEYEMGAAVFVVRMEDLNRLDERYKYDRSVCVFILTADLYDREKYYEAMEGTFHGVIVIPYARIIPLTYQYPDTVFPNVRMYGFADTLILQDRSFRKRHKTLDPECLGNKISWKSSVNKLKSLAEDPKRFINQWVKVGKQLHQNIIRKKKYLSSPLWRDRNLWPLWNPSFTKNGVAVHFPFTPYAPNSNFNEAERRVFFCDTFMSFLPFYTEWNLRPEDMAFFDYSSVPSEYREERSLRNRIAIAKLPYDMYEVLTQYQYSFPHDEEYHHLLANYDAIWWTSSNNSTGNLRRQQLLQEYSSKYQRSRLYFWDPLSATDIRAEVYLIFTDTSKDFLWLLKDKKSFDTEDLLRVTFWMDHLDRICRKLCKYEDRYCVIIPDSDTIKILRRVYNFLPQDLWNGVVPELCKRIVLHESELTYWPNELEILLDEFVGGNEWAFHRYRFSTVQKSPDIDEAAIEKVLSQRLSNEEVACLYDEYMSNYIYVPGNVDEYQKNNIDTTSGNGNKFYDELFDIIDTYYLLINRKGEEAYQLLKKYEHNSFKDISYFPEMIKKMTFLARLYARVDRIEY